MIIKPLTIGNKTFPVNVIQGPLAGVSCAPFRRLLWRYSQPAFACTEMISCKTLLHKPMIAQKRFIDKAADEGPVCFQLASNDPIELAEAVRRVTDYGADLIDLNCGCPVKKMRSRYMGSRLLSDPDKLYHLIRAMKENTTVPVSVKIRVDGQVDSFNDEVIGALKSAAVDFVIVHGRHYTEHYETPCHYDQIQYFVERLDIPVIGNGDIACEASLKKMLATGCAGVMISRASVGQPWLIDKLLATFQKRSFRTPSLREVGEVFVEHIESLAALLNSEKFAVLQARTLAKYYAKGQPMMPALMLDMNTCDSLDALRAICACYFNPKLKI